MTFPRTVESVSVQTPFAGTITSSTVTPVVSASQVSTTWHWPLRSFQPVLPVTTMGSSLR